MTKTEVKNKINKLIKHYNKELLDAVEGVLADADMWYGEDLNYIVHQKNRSDRNADQLISDGSFDYETKISKWLYTRKEIEKREQAISSH